MDGVSEGFKFSFKYVFILAIIFILFIMAYFSNTEYDNKFEITINETSLLARYDTEYVEILFKKYGGDRYNKCVNDNKELFNKLESSNKYLLSIREFEIYDSLGYRQSYNCFVENQELNEIYDNYKTMMVQKDNVIIYNGKFKNDITDIIKEDGRYFFHVYTEQKRPTSPFAYSKTALHFNILVGDKNE